MESNGAGTDTVQQLPIDIAYAKLGEWLVDRKKLPADWRKKLVPVQARTLAALSSLPPTADNWIRALTSDCKQGVNYVLTTWTGTTGYLEAKRVRDSLVDATPDARGLFGRLSGPAAAWDSIVRAYEKDSLFLGDAVQILLQNTNYEIPYERKQIARIQQQLADLDLKEAEFKRNAAASAMKYQHACQELGIAGNHVRAELLGLVNTLPEVFDQVMNAICGDEIGSSLDFYQAFVAYAHTKPECEAEQVLPTLRELRRDPEKRKSKHSLAAEVPVESICSSVDLVQEKGTGASPSEPENTTIDWDIDQDVVARDFDTVGATEISWDVQPSDVQEDNLLEEGQGNQGLADTATQLQEVSQQQPDTTWDSSTDTVEVQMTEICWDIDVVQEEIPTADAGEWLESKATQVAENHVAEGSITVTSSLVDTEFRNRVLDELFEVKAFMRQRLDEMQGGESEALQDQVRAVAPADVQQHGSDSIAGLVQAVTKIVDTLMNDKTRNLIMILTSPRFLDRLEASLRHKKQTETKLSESLSDFSRKRLELRNSLSTLGPRQEATVRRTREVKKFLESALSKQYNGRPVNVVGEINTLLGYG